jgi:homoserine kinase
MTAAFKILAPVCIPGFGAHPKVTACAIDAFSNEILFYPNKQLILSYSTTKINKESAGPGFKNDFFLYLTQEFLSHIDSSGSTLEIKIHIKCPVKYNLGSIESFIAGILFGLSSYHKTGMHKRELLEFIKNSQVIAEAGFSNLMIAGSLLGGFVLKDALQSTDFHRVYTPEGLSINLIINRKNSAIIDGMYERNTEEFIASQTASVVYASLTGNVNMLIDLCNNRQISSIENTREGWVRDIENHLSVYGAFRLSRVNNSPVAMILHENSLKASQFAHWLNKTQKDQGIKKFECLETGINKEGCFKM